MEQRSGNTLQMAVNEKNFIKTSLLSNIRVDARGLLDYRPLIIEFRREDGSSEVQLGQTHVMAFVTAQLVQAYRDRPNEGSLSIYTEFSPMADPSFEPGRPTEPGGIKRQTRSQPYLLVEDLIDTSLVVLGISFLFY